MNDDSTEASPLALGAARWRKSSFSATAECVIVAEVGTAEVGTALALRNSNTPDAGTLLFARRGMATWIAGIKAGEFDDLTG